MEHTKEQGVTIIDPRYRRPAVLRALYAAMAGSGEAAKAADTEAGADEGEKDDGTGFPRTSGVQRNI